MFEGNRKFIGLGVAAVLAIVVIGGGAAVATGQMGDNEEPITGDALQRASEAALAYTGEGRVKETEQGDEDSFYEVEVTLDDGSQVDVQLDENFNVVGGEADDDSAENEDADGDD